MIIQDIDIKHVEFSMINNLDTFSIKHSKRDSWIIKIVEKDGTIGYGESSPLVGFNNETFYQSGYALEGFKLAVNNLNEDLDLEEILILANVHTLDAPSATFAINSAIYDIEAQQKSLSLNMYLNTNALSSIKVNGVYGLSKNYDYKVIKVKCGFRNLYDEIELLEKLTEKYKNKVSFRLDLNQAFDLPKAIRFFKEVEKFNIDYIEQPLNKDNLEDCIELSFHSDIPIALDESITTIDSLKLQLDNNIGEIFIIKPQSLGSFKTIDEAINIIKTENKTAILSSSLEGIIGRYCTMHLVSAHRIDKPCGLALEPIYTIEKDLNLIKKGELVVPNKPGIGVVPF